jgi:hypothetical protein
MKMQDFSRAGFPDAASFAASSLGNDRPNSGNAPACSTFRRERVSICVV